jgi:hypothetical protein
MVAKKQVPNKSTIVKGEDPTQATLPNLSGLQSSSQIDVSTQRTQEEKDKANIATFGTANPMESDRLKLAYAAQHGGMEKRQSATGLSPAIPQTMSPEQVAYRQQLQQALNTPTAQTQEQIDAISAQKGEGVNIGGALAEAAAQGISGATKGAAVGAIGGAAGGTVVLPVIGTVAGTAGGAGLGAAIGFAGNFLGSIYGNLKDDAQKGVASEYASFGNSLINIKAIIKNAGRDPLDAINLYQIELAKIDRAERRLKQSSEADWLSTSKKQLTEIEDFNMFQREQTRQLLIMAINNPAIVQNFEVPQENNMETTQ